MREKQIRSTKSNFLILFVLRIIKTAMQVLVLSLSAKFFGVSVERDVWIIASTLILAIDIIIWGPINETFRTKFIHIRELEGDNWAIKKTKSLFLFTNVVTIFLIGIIYLLSNNIANIFMDQGSSLHQLELLSTLIKILSFSFLFNQVNMLMTSILNAYDIFFVPEIAGFIAAIINVIGIYFLAPIYGIYALAISYYVNLFVLFFLLIFYINKKKIKILPTIQDYNSSYIKDFFLFAFPYYVPYIFSQIYTLSEKAIANYINSGSVSMIDYSRKIIDVPSGVMTSTLVTILLPKLSKSFINKEKKDFNDDFFDALNLGLLFYGVLIGILSAFGNLLVDILFNKGRINIDDLHKIDLLLICYTFSAVTNFMYYIYSYSLLSSKNTRYTAYWGVLPQILMILLNFIFYRFVGVWIFPITYFFAFLVITLIYKRKYPFLVERNSYLLMFRYILFILLLFIIGLAVRNVNFSIITNIYIEVLLKMILISLIVIFLVFILKLNERTMIKTLKNKIFSKTI